jgi:serine/threonine-protein kinase
VGDDGHVHIGPDTDGDLWAPDWPVMMIDYRSVVAYLAWRSERDGLPWRLPSEFEWEKAARGVDGRAYPWGDHHEPTWCAMRSSPSLGPGGRDDYPVDTSPYGARHMAGSCTEWCLESYEHPLDDDGERVVVPPLRADDARHVSRGGSWSTSAYHCRIASRGHGSSHRGMYSKTARMVRPWPPQPSSETSASST